MRVQLGGSEYLSTHHCKMALHPGRRMKSVSQRCLIASTQTFSLLTFFAPQRHSSNVVPSARYLINDCVRCLMCI